MPATTDGEIAVYRARHHHFLVYANNVLGDSFSIRLPSSGISTVLLIEDPLVQLFVFLLSFSCFFFLLGFRWLFL